MDVARYLSTQRSIHEQFEEGQKGFPKGRLSFELHSCPVIEAPEHLAGALEGSGFDRDDAVIYIVFPVDLGEFNRSDFIEAQRLLLQGLKSAPAIAEASGLDPTPLSDFLSSLTESVTK